MPPVRLPGEPVVPVASYPARHSPHAVRERPARICPATWPPRPAADLVAAPRLCGIAQAGLCDELRFGEVEVRAARHGPLWSSSPAARLTRSDHPTIRRSCGDHRASPPPSRSVMTCSWVSAAVARSARLRPPTAWPGMTRLDQHGIRAGICQRLRTRWPECLTRNAAQRRRQRRNRADRGPPIIA